MESPSSESKARARRVPHNFKSRAYTAQQAEQECRVERQALLTEYNATTRDTSREGAINDSSYCGQSTAVNNTHLNRKRFDRAKDTHGDDTTNTLTNRIPFEDTAYLPSAHYATKNYDRTSSEIHLALPDPEIQIPTESTYISHETTEQPLNQHSGTCVDFAIAALEQRMINYIDTTHSDLAARLNNINLSCADIEKKVDKHNDTPPKPNQNNKTMAKPKQNNNTMDGAVERFGDSVKNLGEAISQLSASIDALGVRFGLNGKKDDEADVHEWEKDDCLERFA
ncbi:hypothetical protein KCU85_g4068, partial [Aureobasidium melanogenum]